MDDSLCVWMVVISMVGIVLVVGVFAEAIAKSYEQEHELEWASPKKIIQILYFFREFEITLF